MLKSSFLRGVSFALWFLLTLSVATLGVAYAANGGRFGDLLNKILVSGNWESPGDGTVKNAEKLGGVSANQFTSIKPNQTCSAGKCIVGIKSDGTIDCK